MLKQLHNKLRSRRGASITFALLLFLVCAVVGSAVLVAGSAAGGRMSQVAELDQSYYSVTSAARLLVDMIESEEAVTIVEEQNGDGSVTYKMLDDYDDGIPPIPSFDSLAKDAAYRAVMKETGKLSMTLSVGGAASVGSDDPFSALRTTVTATVADSFSDINTPVAGDQLDNRKLFMTVKSGGGSDKDYELRLIFSADVRETVGNQGDKTLVTRKIKWHIQDVDVIGSAAAGG